MSKFIRITEVQSGVLYINIEHIGYIKKYERKSEYVDKILFEGTSITMTKYLNDRTFLAEENIEEILQMIDEA